MTAKQIELLPDTELNDTIELYQECALTIRDMIELEMLQEEQLERLTKCTQT